MDRIKKLKIKKQDGTFSDYIPIGADAENIDTTDGESVQLKLNKKPYYYDNVADMKADNKLKVGDMAITLGYYEANDGGGAEYKIVSGNYTDDGGSYHELENDLFAELIIRGEINVLTYGIKNTGATTQDRINTMISTFENKGNIAFYFPAGLYKLEETIYLPTKTKIRGDNGATIFLWGGQENTFMFDILSQHNDCVISDICLNGQKKAYGIYDCDKTYNPSGGIRSRFYNIRMDNMKMGIHINAMGSEFHNILCNGSGNNGSYADENSIGFYITGTDNFINNCRVQTFYYGMLITGANNRLVTVKTCVNQIGTKLFPGSSGFYNIDLQENYQDNLIMDGTTEATLIINDQNAGIAQTYYTGDDLQYSLLKMINCASISIKGTLGARSRLGSGSCGNEKYALYIDDQCVNINGDFSYNYTLNTSTATLDKPLFYCNDTVINKIFINNIQLISNKELTDSIIINTVKPGVATSLTFQNNIMTCVYPNTYTLGEIGTFGLFTLQNWEEPKDLIFESDNLAFSYFSIQMSNSSMNLQKSHPFASKKWLTPQGTYKMKVSFPGLTAFKEEYQDYYEQQIGPIDRYMLQLVGYIGNYTMNVTIQELTDDNSDISI